MNNNQFSNSGPLIYTPKKGPNASRPMKQKKGKLPLVLDILVVLLVAGATFAMFKLTNVKPENQEKNNPEVVSAKSLDDSGDEDEEAKIDLNPIITNWLGTFSRDVKKSVMVYDLDKDEVVGNFEENTEFETASVYKLFVAYEGYKRVDNGQWSSSDESFGGMTTLECLDKMVRESHSGCAENLLSKIGEDDLDAILRTNYGLEQTSVSGLKTTAADMVKFLKIINTHKEISNESFARLSDSMLNQPAIELDECNGPCDFRSGLPAGFSKDVKVFNKVGWAWNGAFWTVYDDVAILECPKSGRRFAMVVLTSGLQEQNVISRLGEMTEEAILAYLEYLE